ncbi:hypothetical protein EZS27_029745 [termite gut metagenome]|uniref:Glycoside hydrolase family 29 N-terminal domain-containing protein n=1 Tax=termite gut metagenome TaxID=433724 RepID=A0A5J4QHU5_9ZZZZ
MHLLVRTAGMGANLLLNVGPMPNGKIMPEHTERLLAMGEWLKEYGYTIYETEQGFVKPQPWGACTGKGKTIYIHVLDKEVSSLTLPVPNIKSAQWVNVNSKLAWKKDKGTGDVTFIFDGGGLDETDSIIKVTVK